MNNATKQNEPTKVEKDVLKNSSKNQQQKSAVEATPGRYTLVDFERALDDEYWCFETFVKFHELTLDDIYNNIAALKRNI